MTQQIDQMISSLDRLTTEAMDPDLMNIDAMDTESRLRIMNAEDAKVALAIEMQIPQIARAVHRVAHSLRIGGRLFYIGAGTSGRLGVLDAVECPPTFGVSSTTVQGIIAGGNDAMFKAVEGAEDDPDEGAAAIIESDISPNDSVIGISASGRAPFVMGALRQAKKRGATTIGISNNHPSELAPYANVLIEIVVGPEILAGSTRLKCGTAQKMVLNMISTGAMMEIGKTYGNLMVDVQATNTKLKARAMRIISQVTGCTLEESTKALDRAEGSAKLAIIMIQSGKTLDDAKGLLDQSGGYLRKALALAGLKSSH